VPPIPPILPSIHPSITSIQSNAFVHLFIYTGYVVVDTYFTSLDELDHDELIYLVKGKEGGVDRLIGVRYGHHRIFKLRRDLSP
jgi:hypothetical protein